MKTSKSNTNLAKVIKSLSDSEIVVITRELVNGVDLNGILVQLNGKNDFGNFTSLDRTELSNVLLTELSERLLIFAPFFDELPNL